MFPTRISGLTWFASNRFTPGETMLRRSRTESIDPRFVAMEFLRRPHAPDGQITH
jgi:hypothetical protein